MNFPTSSLRAFLSTAKMTLKTALRNKTPVNLVIGNESADLDAITSSILYAYLRSTLPAPVGFPGLYIPLLNIPRADIRIRPELLALLPHANIDSDHLITLDDLPPQSSISSQLDPHMTRWILVDHNALQGPLGVTYSDRVQGCIDHHVDENKVPRPENAVGGDPRIITTAGSCTSLIVNHFRPAWDSLSASASASKTSGGQSDAIVGTDDVAVRRTWDMQVAKLAMASVLLDTHDMKDEHKVTENDERAVKYLENKISLARQGAQFVRSELFEEINRAKKDLDGLSIMECLRKDYKQWGEKDKQLGVAVIVKSLSYLAAKAGKDEFYVELDTFARERHLAVLVVMTAFSSDEGEFQRQLLVRVLDPTMKGFLSSLQEIDNSELQLEECQEVSTSSGETPTRVWWQRDISKSRKQVAPLLREALKDSPAQDMIEGSVSL